MKILLFTHKNDIDGMGNAILANLAFSKVDYVLCGTFNLTENILKYYDNGAIYHYDQIFITDLCLEEPLLTRIANDKNLKGKILNFDHHQTFTDKKYTQHSFIQVQVKNEQGLCCATSLFYNYLVSKNFIDQNNLAIKEFVELTRQHDTWEWKTIYQNEKARHLATLFDVIGTDTYIDLMSQKLSHYENKTFEFDHFEHPLINNRLKQITEKLKIYSHNLVYKDILGLKAGIVFITYEYRNELAEYLKENNFNIDFVMMIALDPGVVCYRSVKEDIIVREIAEFFGGKGHNKAASNPITQEFQSKIIDLLITPKDKEDSKI